MRGSSFSQGQVHLRAYPPPQMEDAAGAPVTRLATPGPSQTSRSTSRQRLGACADLWEGRGSLGVGQRRWRSEITQHSLPCLCRTLRSRLTQSRREADRHKSHTRWGFKWLGHVQVRRCHLTREGASLGVAQRAGEETQSTWLLPTHSTAPTPTPHPSHPGGARLTALLGKIPPRPRSIHTQLSSRVAPNPLLLDNRCPSLRPCQVLLL